ncbi:MAG TPA: FkbM family methyltransferase [Bradyrhizobium sp.]|nr:FkbM family methyltransferase [Bradyrhizobium sp.]
MSRRYFRFPIHRVEVTARKAYCNAMEWLGYRDYVVAAQGAFFVVNTADLIDRSIAWFGIWEGDQLEDLARVCATRNADYFFDIGANSGFYSVMFARKGVVPQVIAFEPDPGNYAHLLANLHVNNLAPKVRTFPFAVGAQAGEVELMEAGGHNRGESWIAHPDKPPEEAPGVATHKVRQVRFDDEFAIAGKTLVIKMDVEGSEFHALKGMERTLRDNRCYLQVELYSDRIEELKALFAGLGYRYLKTADIDHYFTNIPDIE